jgi:hypothetical protein
MIVAKGLPPLPTAVAAAPKPDPEPDYEKCRPQDATVLLPIITHMVRSADDGRARMMFDYLGDMARYPDIPLPTQRADGRAEHGTRQAVIYAAVVRAIRLIRDHAPAKQIKEAFNFAHDATFEPCCFLVGDVEKGFTVQFIDPSTTGR